MLDPIARVRWGAYRSRNLRDESVPPDVNEGEGDLVGFVTSSDGLPCGVVRVGGRYLNVHLDRIEDVRVAAEKD